MDTDLLRYPIGRFQAVRPAGPEQIRELVAQLAQAPGLLRAAVADLSESQLDTPYRPEGWTVRQVVHHLADAHLNWYVRTRLALTEDRPAVKPYDEGAWAQLEDARTGPIQPSLLLLEGLYERWVRLFESLAPADWTRTMMHPERGVFVMDTMLAMMVWHGRHHTAHITELRRRMGWR